MKNITRWVYNTLYARLGLRCAMATTNALCELNHGKHQTRTSNSWLRFTIWLHMEKVMSKHNLSCSLMLAVMNCISFYKLWDLCACTSSRRIYERWHGQGFVGLRPSFCRHILSCSSKNVSGWSLSIAQVTLAPHELRYSSLVNK